MKSLTTSMTAAVLAVILSTSLHAQAPALPKDLEQRQLQAEITDKDWLVYGGNFKAWRYSGLDQITRENVKNLKVAWKIETDLHDAFEASPIIVDGVMYFSTPWNHVYAVNAKTGEKLWHYVHPLERSLPLCCGAVNRGVAVGHGKVAFGTLDSRIIALDATSGKKVWEVHPASKDEGYSYTVAPQIIKGKVIIAASGGDFGARTFIDAVDVNTGKAAWRFWCIPGPGEPGHETWEGDSWKRGGGGAWMPVTYDKETNLIFAGIGNPGPDLDGEKRKGDNLYTESMVALDADTGKLKWYFQVIPHDVWDLDNVVEGLIDDVKINGQVRKVLMFASKNGFFYMLDRNTGKCIYAIQYVHKVNWGKVDPDGTPHPDPKMFPTKDKWVEVYPGASGGKEWCPVAYDPKRKRMFVPVIENGHRHKVLEQDFKPGLNYWGGASATIPGKGYGHITAIDVEKKRIAWDTRTKFPVVCGMACTATGLVITGTPDQKMLILDADSGKILHEYSAPSGWHSAPSIYAVDGREYIAFPNGWGGWVAGFDAEGTPELSSLPDVNTLFVFALPNPKEAQTQPAPKERHE